MQRTGFACWQLLGSLDTQLLSLIKNASTGIANSKLTAPPKPSV